MPTSGVQQALDRLIDTMPVLRPAPEILTELLVLLCESHPDQQRVLELVQLDPALTTRLLRICNDPCSSCPGTISDVPWAVAKLGSDAVHQIVTQTLCDYWRYRRPAAREPATPSWRQAVAAGILGRMISTYADLKPQLVFTAALIHDVGRMIVDSVVDHVREELNQRKDSIDTSVLTEAYVRDLDPEELAGRTLERWSFPESLIAAVRSARQPMQATVHQGLVWSVHLAIGLAPQLSSGQDPSLARMACLEAAVKLDLSASEVQRILEQARTLLGAISPRLAA